MNEIINDELSIAIPEGFRHMSTEELRRIYTTEIETIRGFWDEERHVIVIVTWNVSNKVIARIASVKDIAKRVEKAQSRALKGNAYRKDGFFDTTVAGEKARGVRFGYTVQGIGQDAEAVVFIHGASCYTLYYYCRSDDAQRLSPLHDDLLSSLAFVK